MARPKKVWVYKPALDARTKVSPALKAEVECKAKALIEATLGPTHVKPPPTEGTYNYIIGFSTKWHSRFFTFIATYACPHPEAVAPTFESKFARMEHTAAGTFNLAFRRHTGAWHDLFLGQTLDECLEAIRDDPWFVP